MTEIKCHWEGCKFNKQQICSKETIELGMIQFDMFKWTEDHHLRDYDDRNCKSYDYLICKDYKNR